MMDDETDWISRDQVSTACMKNILTVALLYSRYIGSFMIFLWPAYSFACIHAKMNVSSFWLVPPVVVWVMEMLND